MISQQGQNPCKKNVLLQNKTGRQPVIFAAETTALKTSQRMMPLYRYHQHWGGRRFFLRIDHNCQTQFIYMWQIARTAWPGDRLSDQAVLFLPYTWWDCSCGIPRRQPPNLALCSSFPIWLINGRKLITWSAHIVSYIDEFQVYILKKILYNN